MRTALGLSSSLAAATETLVAKSVHIYTHCRKPWVSIASVAMDIRFYFDADSELPHIYNHGVHEDE